MAELTDCVPWIDEKNPPSRWASGPWCFCLENARPLEFHPLRGQLGVFEVDFTLPEESDAHMR